MEIKFCAKNSKAKTTSKLTRDNKTKMSKMLNKEHTTSTKSKNLKKERSVGEAKTKIVNQIIEQIKETLEDPIEEVDSTDGFKAPSRKYFNQYWINLRI